MAIIKEQLVSGLFRTRSDAGFYIHGGVPEGNYEEAVDPEIREYAETEIPIEEDDGDDFYEEAGKILLGEGE